MSQSPYKPEKMPPKGLDSARLIVPVGEANAALARYDGLLQSLVNPDILLAPLAGQEAVLSSRIEGTQATVEEVLEHEAGQTYEADKEEDIREILNYGEALSLGREAIREQPVRLAMIRELHKRLMSSVRGEDKMPGEFRNVQNWIGKPGCTMEEASFVPPSPLQLRDHLQDWEVYLEYRDTDPLIQCAVIHAQFELLHPFQDGNGRIGRLLIPLFLCQANRLTEPMFYLSAYLERNRSEYYDRLQAISTEGAWVEWVVFFLQAITEQAQVNTDRVKRIHKLYEEMKTTVRKLTRSQHIIQLVDELFKRPIFSISDIKSAGIRTKRAHELVQRLIKAGIIVVSREAAGRRPAILHFPELLRIISSI